MIPRVLLVEDNISDIELVQTAFAESDISIELILARDGDVAISEIERRAGDAATRPILTLLDLNLPRASGLVVLGRIRSIAAYNTMPVVILSTSNYPVDRDRALAAGANDYLVKPTRFEDLLTIVKGLDQRWLKANRG